jgi:hypothetical protein
MDKVPKEKIVSFNFSCGVFSLFDFLMPVDGINKLYQSIGNELTFYAV